MNPIEAASGLCYVEGDGERGIDAIVVFCINLVYHLESLWTIRFHSNLMKKEKKSQISFKKLSLHKLKQHFC